VGLTLREFTTPHGEGVNLLVNLRFPTEWGEICKIFGVTTVDRPSLCAIRWKR